MAKFEVTTSNLPNLIYLSGETADGQVYVDSAESTADNPYLQDNTLVITNPVRLRYDKNIPLKAICKVKYSDGSSIPKNTIKKIVEKQSTGLMKKEDVIDLKPVEIVITFDDGSTKNFKPNEIKVHMKNK